MNGIRNCTAIHCCVVCTSSLLRDRIERIEVRRVQPPPGVGQRYVELVLCGRSPPGVEDEVALVVAVGVQPDAVRAVHGGLKVVAEAEGGHAAGENMIAFPLKSILHILRESYIRTTEPVTMNGSKQPLSIKYKGGGVK